MTIASDYAGLWSWLKADTGYADQSGNGRDGTPGVGAPAIWDLVANGHKAFRFSAASSQYISLPSMAALTKGEMFIVIATFKDPPTVGTHTGCWDMGTQASNSSYLPFTDNVIYETFGSTVRKTVGAHTANLATDVRVVNIWSDTNDWGYAMEGTTLFSTATNAVFFPTAPNLGQGVHDHNFLDGYIAEWFLYSQLRSPSERTALVSALQATYQGAFVPAPRIICSQLIQAGSGSGTGGTGGGPGGLGDTAGGAAWMYRKG